MTGIQELMSILILPTLKLGWVHLSKLLILVLLLIGQDWSSHTWEFTRQGHTIKYMRNWWLTHQILERWNLLLIWGLGPHSSLRTL